MDHLMDTFLDYIQWEISSIDEVLGLVGPTSSLVDWMEIRRRLVERQSLVVSVRDGLFSQ